MSSLIICTTDCGSGCFKVLWCILSLILGASDLRHVCNDHVSNGTLRMYVTASVTHSPEVRIDLLTFMQIVNNFALEPYSKLCLFHNLFVNRNGCQISMRFNEANCAWNN